MKGIKDFENYNEEDCMLLYLEKLKSIWKYDEEIYECHLGVSISFFSNCLSSNNRNFILNTI